MVAIHAKLQRIFEMAAIGYEESLCVDTALSFKIDLNSRR